MNIFYLKIINIKYKIFERNNPVTAIGSDSITRLSVERVVNLFT